MKLSTFASMALIPLAALAACGGGQMRSNEFSVDWQDDHGLSIGRIWAQVATATVPASADVVVGIAEPGDRLVGLPLSSGNKWTFTHPLAARPDLARNGNR